MAEVYDNVEWVTAEIVSNSAPFAALGARMYAAVMSAAAETTDTGAFIESVKVERWPAQGFPFYKRFTSATRDWVVYSDDWAVVIIEFGATYRRKGKLIHQAPQHAFRKAVARI